MYKPVRSINLTETRDPDLLRRINYLGQSKRLMAATALRLLLQDVLPQAQDTEGPQKPPQKKRMKKNGETDHTEGTM